MQFIGDNVRFLQEAFQDMQAALATYSDVYEGAKKGAAAPEILARADEKLDAADLAYLSENVPPAIAHTLEGVERVSHIVSAMKEFSHPGGHERTPSDLNRGIETTVTVARNEWKYVAEMKLDLDPGLPHVPCLLGEINQAVLNLIVNAAHAIGEVVKHKPGAKGLITLQTRLEGDQVEIRLSDTGTGIPKAIHARIFEPFFTTKDVGKGTGQGLAMVYTCIVKKHGGTVRFETTDGEGTTFVIRLPLSKLQAEG